MQKISHLFSRKFFKAMYNVRNTLHMKLIRPSRKKGGGKVISIFTNVRCSSALDIQCHVHVATCRSETYKYYTVFLSLCVFLCACVCVHVRVFMCVCACVCVCMQYSGHRGQDQLAASGCAAATAARSAAGEGGEGGPAGRGGQAGQAAGEL